MKILFVVDTIKWAIGHLAESVKKYNNRYNIKIIEVHPRDAGEKIVQDNFLKQVKEFNPDIIQFEYFRTCGQLMEALPELKDYKTCLMHHNMRTKALYMYDWGNNQELDKSHINLDKVLVHCNQTKKLLEEKGYAKDVEVIRYGFDHDYWTYNGKEPNELVIGYGGRIVPWKGMKELSEVAKELNYPIEMMGKIEKPNYWEECTKDNIRFNFTECSDEERINFFRNITIFVQNAKDGYEEGPMPMMEAMASGVPVITTPAGQAGLEEGIFKDRENCLMIPFEDKEMLKSAIDELMNDKKLRDRLRKNGWNTVKNMTEEKMARDYAKIWNKMLFEIPLVSIIIPCTYNRIEQLKQILEAYKKQSYKNIEIIIAWDELDSEYAELDNIKDYHLSIKQVWTGLDKEKHPYNLGRARNLAVIEARGKILIFNDSRLAPKNDAVYQFVNQLENGDKKQWVFGEKGSNKTSFVENFSAIYRKDLIIFGMFPEFMNQYGGMTQELRSRWKLQGNEFIYCFLAVAQEIKSSKNNDKKKQEIVKSKQLLEKLYGNQRI